MLKNFHILHESLSIALHRFIVGNTSITSAWHHKELTQAVSTHNSAQSVRGDTVPGTM